MKDIMKVAAIFAAGLFVGETLEYIRKAKQIDLLRKDRDHSYDLYRKEVDRGNDLVEEIQRLDLELQQCKLTNWQCATYASSLKKQLDNLIE